MYFRVKTKQKKTHQHEIKGFVLFIVAFLLGYCLVIPAQSGAIGQAVCRIAFLLFGNASYLLPVITLWFGILQFKYPEQPRWRLEIIVSLLLLSITAAFFSISGKLFYDINYGGWLGIKLNPFFRRLFGNHVALLLIAGLFAYLSSILLRISLRTLSVTVWRKLVEDYEYWLAEKEEVKKNKPPKIKTAEKTAPKVEQRAEPVKQEPKIVTQPKQTPSDSKQISKQPAPQVQKKAEPIVSVPAVTFEYKLPPLDLLVDTKDNIKEQCDKSLREAARPLWPNPEEKNICCTILTI